MGYCPSQASSKIQEPTPSFFSFRASENWIPSKPKANIRRNPSAGAEIKIPAKMVVKMWE